MWTEASCSSLELKKGAGAPKGPRSPTSLMALCWKRRSLGSAGAPTELLGITTWPLGRLKLTIGI